MKKTVIKLTIALLSVIFCSQAITNIFTLHKQICFEYVVDNFDQIEDHSEEDELKNTDDTFIHITLKENLSPNLHSYRLSGKLSFVWQPPKMILKRG
jgi:hypothetical protein